jgi:ribosome biogenesis GTPase
MELDRLGWHEFFSNHFEPYETKRYAPARVAREDKHVYTVYGTAGELAARVAGRLLHSAKSRGDFPAVGDWVAIDPRPEEGKATIHAVLPRRSKFVRKVVSVKTEEQVLAANIDTVFLVSALGGDFNLRRLERYLTLAWESGAMPVVVLNKADLCDDVETLIDEAGSVACGVTIHAISALEGLGLEVLETYLAPGKTVALLGSSGVGKSTLINSLMRTDLLEVGEVRASDGRGRHITSSRQLVVLPDGGMIIDTPGMRELQLWADEKSLGASFEDVDKLAQGCRFRDCKHQAEPGCAVKDAVESGALDAKRLKSYRKLRRELKVLGVRQDQRARIYERTRWKQVAKWSRQRQRFKSRNR